MPFHATKGAEVDTYDESVNVLDADEFKKAKIGGADHKLARPDEDFLLLLHTNRIPLYALLRLCQVKITMVRQFGMYKHEPNECVTEFNVAMRNLFADYFDTTSTDDPTRIEAEAVLEALISNLGGAHLEAYQRQTIEVAEQKKAELRSDAEPIAEAPSIKIAARSKFKKDHPDLSLRGRDFMNDYLWDVIKLMLRKLCFQHIVIDVFISLAEQVEIAVAKRSIKHEEIEKYRKGSIVAKPVTSNGDIIRRVRSSWILMDNIALVSWENIGREWMSAMDEFITVYNPSFEALLFFDNETRKKACDLWREENDTYKTYPDACRAVLGSKTDRKWFTTIGTMAFNKHGAAKHGPGPAQADTLVYSGYGAPDVLPGGLREKRSASKELSDDEDSADEKKGGSRKKARYRATRDYDRRGADARLSSMQSKLDKALNAVKGMKGKGKGWGYKGKDWQQVQQTAYEKKGGGKGNRGKRGGKKKQAAQQMITDNADLTAPRQSRRVSAEEMAKIQEALKASFKKGCKYCYQYNSSLGCENDSASCFEHACIKGGANHALCAHH